MAKRVLKRQIKIDRDRQKKHKKQREDQKSTIEKKKGLQQPWNTSTTNSIDKDSWDNKNNSREAI